MHSSVRSTMPFRSAGKRAVAADRRVAAAFASPAAPPSVFAAAFDGARALTPQKRACSRWRALPSAAMVRIIPSPKSLAPGVAPASRLVARRFGDGSAPLGAHGPTMRTSLRRARLGTTLARVDDAVGAARIGAAGATCASASVSEFGHRSVGRTIDRRRPESRMPAHRATRWSAIRRRAEARARGMKRACLHVGPARRG